MERTHVSSVSKSHACWYCWSRPPTTAVVGRLDRGGVGRGWVDGKKVVAGEDIVDTVGGDDVDTVVVAAAVAAAGHVATDHSRETGNSPAVDKMLLAERSCLVDYFCYCY